MELLRKLSVILPPMIFLYLALKNLTIPTSMASLWAAKFFIIYGFIFAAFLGVITALTPSFIFLLIPLASVPFFSVKLLVPSIVAFAVAYFSAIFMQRRFVRPSPFFGAQIFIRSFFFFFLLLYAVFYVSENHIEEKINITLPQPIMSLAVRQVASQLPCNMNETFTECASRLVERTIAEKCGNDIACRAAFETQREKLVASTAADLASQLNATAEETVEAAVSKFINLQVNSFLSKIGLRYIAAALTFGFVLMLSWVMGLLAFPAGIAAALFFNIYKALGILKPKMETVRVIKYEV